MQRICHRWRQLQFYLSRPFRTPPLSRLRLRHGRFTWAHGRQLALIAAITGALYWLQATPVAAASGQCTNGQTAAPETPVDAWMTLAAGDQQWYAFRDEGDDIPITIRMTVVPAGGARFIVLTAAQATDWARGETTTAVGQGTPSSVVNDDLYWTGSFVQSGTYYVLVKSNNQGLSNYKLLINGKRVADPLLSFAWSNPPTSTVEAICPPPAESTNTAPQTTATPTVAIPPVVTTTVFTSSPENPLPPIGKRLAIALGERHWYAFRDEGDDATIQIRADATPDHCLTFQVWSAEQLRLWRLNESFDPVGEGTANASLKADLFWSGSFVKSGTYYVVVTHDRAIPNGCTYALAVTGNDVSLVNPPLAP